VNTSWRKRWIWSALPSACSCTSDNVAPWQPSSCAWISDLSYHSYRLAVTHSPPKLYFWNAVHSFASATWSVDADFPFLFTLCRLKWLFRFSKYPSLLWKLSSSRPVSAYLYNHMAFPVTTVPLAHSPSCASSSCHMQKALSGF